MLQKELGWRTLAKRHSIARMMLVHRCVMGQATTCLCERVRMNNHGTRGNNKLLGKLAVPVLDPQKLNDFLKKSVFGLLSRNLVSTI